LPCLANARLRRLQFDFRKSGIGGVILNPPAPEDPCAAAILNATGKWLTVVNNSFTPPNNENVNFFSFNQPSVNSKGRVVFRGRAKAAAGTGGEAAREGGGETGGEPVSGVWFRDQCGGTTAITTLADRNTLVPAPNSNSVVFNEFPSFPRIDMSTGLMATRGNHQPVETVVLPDTTTTRAGTTGIYVFDTILKTGMSNLGNFVQFQVFEVPGVPPGTKFDVFPGSASVSDGKNIAFKGNFVVEGSGKTGVFFRDLSNPSNPPVLIANSDTLIPGQEPGGNVTFDSTAPPSSANGKIVFTGLDNEEAPTMGGIYLAPLAPQPTLTTLVGIGSQVPDSNGNALGDGSTFNALGEALSFDGRFVTFWGAWGHQKREQILDCPTDGNKDLIAYCMANSPLPGGKTPVQIPVNQGIFVIDTITGSTKLVARTGEGETFHDFLYWVYSGRPPGVGGEGDGDGGEAEPPRWRSSAFAAVDGTRGVVFKGSKTPGQGVPASGIYASALVNGNPSVALKVLEVGDGAGPIDASAPAGSTVSAVGIEREAIRGGWFTLTASFLNPELESWAGVYLTFVPTFTVLPATNPGLPVTN